MTDEKKLVAEEELEGLSDEQLAQIAGGTEESHRMTREELLEFIKEHCTPFYPEYVEE